MKRNTIKWRIFKYNLMIIIVLIALTTVIFNIAVRIYIESDITRQLSTIALHAEETALQRGPDFFPDAGAKTPPPPPGVQTGNSHGGSDLFRFYFMLDRSLREPLSVLNADYILLDSGKEIITSPQEDYFRPSSDILNKITGEIGKLKNPGSEKYMNFTLSGTEYTAIIKPVSGKNTFGLGWIIIYSSLQKVNQLQWAINGMLLAIVILSALIIGIFSSLAAKKISAPFSSLNKHIGAIAERNFGTKIHLPVDDELQEFVSNINVLSEKLESYDKAQKTFLQNVSHEFRTPLMSIQSYAEGIQYDVVDENTAAGIIIDETRRLTHLVEDLLYLSRLDGIEENYRFSSLDVNEFVKSCVERMGAIAAKDNVLLVSGSLDEKVGIYADEEKLSRALTNLISNCIRYANTTVRVIPKTDGSGKIEISVSDDGPGFESGELPNIFERFYKGKKGNFGLGLSISKNVIERHNGKITAENSKSGAVFTIVLPLSNQRDPSPEARSH